MVAPVCMEGPSNTDNLPKRKKTPLFATFSQDDGYRAVFQSRTPSYPPMVNRCCLLVSPLQYIKFIFLPRITTNTEINRQKLLQIVFSCNTPHYIAPKALCLLVTLLFTFPLQFFFFFYCTTNLIPSPSYHFSQVPKICIFMTPLKLSEYISTFSMSATEYAMMKLMF